MLTVPLVTKNNKITYTCGSLGIVSLFVPQMLVIWNGYCVNIIKSRDRFHPKYFMGKHNFIAHWGPVCKDWKTYA